MRGWWPEAAAVAVVVVLGVGVWVRGEAPRPAAFPVWTEPRARARRAQDSRGGRRDPLLQLVPTGASLALVIEGSTLRASPTVRAWLGCLEPALVTDVERRLGAPLAQQAGVERWLLMRSSEGALLGLQGGMAAAARGQGSVVPGGIVLFGEERAVQTARAGGEAGLAPELAYGEVYGVMGPEAFAPLWPRSMRDNATHTLARLELHADLRDGVWWTRAEGSTEAGGGHGHERREMVFLARNVADRLEQERAASDAPRRAQLATSAVSFAQGHAIAQLALADEVVRDQAVTCAGRAAQPAPP